MNVMLSFRDRKEAEALENAFKKHISVQQVINAIDVGFVWEQLRIGYATTAIVDIEKIKNNYMSNLKQISDLVVEKPEVKIMLVGGGSEELMASTAFKFGVSYAIMRPYDVEDIVKRVIDMNESPIIINEDYANKAKNAVIEREASAILNSTGILPNLKGYKYLKDAIIMGCRDVSVLEAVTKFLYPEIAKQNNTNAERVERAIRHAIESAWKRCGGNGFYAKMGFAENFNERRPTNSEYIFTVVEYLKNSNIF